MKVINTFRKNMLSLDKKRFSPFEALGQGLKKIYCKFSL